MIGSGDQDAVVAKSLLVRHRFSADPGLLSASSRWNRSPLSNTTLTRTTRPSGWNLFPIRGHFLAICASCGGDLLSFGLATSVSRRRTGPSERPLHRLPVSRRPSSWAPTAARSSENGASGPGLRGRDVRALFRGCTRRLQPLQDCWHPEQARGCAPAQGTHWTRLALAELIDNPFYLRAGGALQAARPPATPIPRYPHPGDGGRRSSRRRIALAEGASGGANPRLSAKEQWHGCARKSAQTRLP